MYRNAIAGRGGRRRDARVGNLGNVRGKAGRRIGNRHITALQGRVPPPSERGDDGVVPEMPLIHDRFGRDCLFEQRGPRAELIHVGARIEQARDRGGIARIVGRIISLSQGHGGTLVGRPIRVEVGRSVHDPRIRWVDAGAFGPHRRVTGSGQWRTQGWAGWHPSPFSRAARARDTRSK